MTASSVAVFHEYQSGRASKYFLSAAWMPTTISSVSVRYLAERSVTLQFTRMNWVVTGRTCERRPNPSHASASTWPNESHIHWLEAEVSFDPQEANVPH